MTTWSETHLQDLDICQKLLPQQLDAIAIELKLAVGVNRKDRYVAAEYEIKYMYKLVSRGIDDNEYMSL